MDENIISSREISDLHNDFFKKSHQLVFSQLALTPVEHDIMALFLTKLHKDHWGDYINKKKIEYTPRYEFSSSLLSTWFGVEKTYLHSTLEKPAERLSEKKIGIKDKSKKAFDFMPLFKRIRYVDGVLTVVPNDELINEYLGVSQGHSQIPHEQFRALPLEHAKRLFTMLCRFRNDKGVLHPQSIKDLHAFFGLNDQEGNLQKKTYANTSVFIRRIIKPAIEAIDKVVPEITFDVDEKTGNFGYGLIKEGRSIVAIKFLYRWEVKNDKPEPEADEAKFMRRLLTTFSLVESFQHDQLGNPTLQELSELTDNIGKLMDEGKKFNEKFMINLNMAQAEARTREL